VSVAGETAADPSRRVHIASVLVDGAPVEFPDGLLVLFHKPAGVVCSHEVGEGPRVYDLLPDRWNHRNPPVSSVGRLDKDATGLLVLTDAGDWIHRWTSPRHHVPKRYEVAVDSDLNPVCVERFASGTLLLDGESEPCRPAHLEILGPREARIELTEGRYHQVKRMFGSQGARVVRLHRTHFGPFALEDLPEGHWRAVPFPS